MGVWLASGLLALAAPGGASAPEAAVWRARWIAAPSAPLHGPGVYHFRRTFDLPQRPARFPVRVSGDNRYRLYVNGVEVASGPARGDPMHWRYETLDLAPHLVAGRNVIAAMVWDMGNLRPAAQTSVATAFLLQGETDAEAVVDSGPEWKAAIDHAYAFDPVVEPDSGGFYVAGPGETVEAGRLPWGWQARDYDDSGWQPATPVQLSFGHTSAVARGGNPYGGAAEWQLVPRTIPMPEQTPVRFAQIRRASGIAVPAGFLAGQAPLVIPPHSHVSLLLDQGATTMGFPVLRTSGGEGASATLTYAESLFDAQGRKGNRNAIDGKTIRGLRDRIRFDGGSDRAFKPLWLRAWRYLQIDVDTAGQPLRIDDLSSIFTAYPFTQRAAFESDAGWITPIWDINWRSLRMSAFETFWDTPYYEQLQYVGDTRIESILSVYQTGDDRLMRNAIAAFDDSRLSEGLTASSWPSGARQQIPPFSLWWVAMVHDYWMLRGDREFASERLAGIRAVIGWYERRIDATGMVGAAPWWNFLDWTDPFPQGIPPGGGTGRSAPISLQLAYALDRAAALEDAVGRADEARHDRALAARVIAAVRSETWDEGRGLFADDPRHASFSQHTNALAVLAGAVPADRQAAIMEKVLGDPSLVQASYYFRFYIDEAMRQAGLADRYLGRLEPWRVMIANGLTTTAETPEPTRSDSHAWSAHPNYHLLATVLGIRPASPGFATVEIAPALGALKHASGRMPVPQGEIRVAFRRSVASAAAGATDRPMDGVIDLPAGMSGRFRHRDWLVDLHPGRNVVTCKARCALR